MAPTIGRTVIFTQPENEIPRNGTRQHPAVVTRVHGSGEHPAVNLTVFFDAGSPESRTSQFHRPLDVDSPNGGWDWPAKV